MRMIYILKSLVDSIIEETLVNEPLETGGMLLGYIEQRNYYVVDLIDAGPKAIHDSDYFLSDGKYQQPLLEQKFFNSNGRITFLGDWHSHPNGDSYLSQLDMDTLKNISEDQGAQIACPISIIIGTSPCKIRGFNYEKGKYQKLDLKKIDILK